MKKQIISLGALAVASSLFTWDNKADAIVTKDYNGKSQVKKESKNGTLIDSRYYWEKIEALEKQFSSALALTDEYQYGGNEYKEAKDKLMERILGEDQYLLKKKIDEYDYYKKWYKATYPNDNSKMYSFHKYNVYYLTMNEYNEISNLLKDAVEKFNNEVRDIQSKNEDLKPYDENTEKQETDKIYEFVSEIDTVFAAYYSHEKFGIHAKELRAKLDIILGDVHNPNRITNERIKKEMMEDLNSIVDDFFMETNQNRPTTIKKYDPNIHDYTKKKENKENFDKLVKETREAVEKADESWKNKTVKKYEETVTKSPFVKEEKKVEEPQLPKVGNQQEVKTTAGKAEETTQPLVKIPQGTITGEIVKGPDYPTMENKTLQGTQGESSDIEVKPQATETTEASQYGPRPQFNKTPKYVKYRDAGTGIREYNDGTFGYEARPRFNKPSETNAYNVTTNQDGTVTYGARPTQNKPSKTNAYNVTTHANGQVSYGARPTYKKPSETNAYNVTTHANGQVSYGARPTQNKASETNAYNVTTHANGQVSYGARPTQNKPSKTNAYNVTTHGNGQVSYGARPTYKKPSETNAYNVTTHADGTATYGPRVTK
ncbi:TPA: staphylocoagulase [Staphylococcus aureus]|nr:staphylocoagulase [Staphylococcus aureus]HCU8775107.1 staphylocoagulase [Staphylococcus aureus]